MIDKSQIWKHWKRHINCVFICAFLCLITWTKFPSINDFECVLFIHHQNINTRRWNHSSVRVFCLSFSCYATYHIFMQSVLHVTPIFTIGFRPNIRWSCLIIIIQVPRISVIGWWLVWILPPLSVKDKCQYIQSCRLSNTQFSFYLYFVAGLETIYFLISDRD